MARWMRLDIFNQLLSGGLLPLFYHDDAATAIEIVAACRRGGVRLVEFTNRGHMAYPVFAELTRHFARHDPSVALGVGSIQDAPSAALFIAAGAHFVVSPSFNAEVARLCNRRKIAYLPGAATEKEISEAEEWGAEIVKLVPGETVGGPAFIRAVMAPCPWHRLMPTGGVDATEASVGEWIRAGAAAVGVGSKLITRQAVAGREFDRVAETTAQVLGWIETARRGD